MGEWVGHGYTVNMTVRYVDGTTWSISDRSAVQRRILDGPPLSHDFLDEVGVRVVDAPGED